SRHRREKLISAVTQSAPSPKENAADSVGNAVEIRELGLKAREAMAGFPETQRRALELAYFSGHSHSEIALALRLPLGTVKTMIRQGLIFLRGRMDEKWS
ncbi:MAG: sigma factor-like helix-turn-helix DNA-binding protein, partial [Verrucomicrobium sp.]|nr:sigma factor-like helix-turn-helix DNA-binding protein [Verrucomicrobium sp.]